MDENISKSELKRARAMQAVKRKAVKKIVTVLLVLLGLAALVTWIVSYNRSRQTNLPGEFIPEQGREHVGASHAHTYNSNPPTSGPHFPREAEWGVYKQELVDETVIHNLEHGGIWISYKPDITEEMRKKLEGWYDKYGRKIIVTPRSKSDSDIALAAWTRLDKFGVSEYSDERVEKFIKAYRNKGPEYVP